MWWGIVSGSRSCNATEREREASRPRSRSFSCDFGSRSTLEEGVGGDAFTMDAELGPWCDGNQDR